LSDKRFLNADERATQIGDRMTLRKIAFLRIVSLTLMLPGLAGLVISATVSTNYLQNLPQRPVPAELRMIPRNIHGTTVYQTADEDRKLSIMEYSSVAVFLIGLVFGVVYLERWAAVRQAERLSEAELFEEVKV